MKTLLKFVLSAMAIMIGAYLLEGVHVQDFVSALIVAVVLGLLNTFVKPVLILLTLPITVLTLGLFLIVLNTFMFMLAGHFVSGFHLDGFVTALIFSVLYSIAMSFLEWITGMESK